MFRAMHLDFLVFFFYVVIELKSQIEVQTIGIMTSFYLVIGGNRGIGEECVRRLVERIASTNNDHKHLIIATSRDASSAIVTC